mgnify:FL=1
MSRLLFASSAALALALGGASVAHAGQSLKFGGAAYDPTPTIVYSTTNAGVDSVEIALTPEGAAPSVTNYGFNTITATDKDDSTSRGAANQTFDGDATGFVFNTTVTFRDASGNVLANDTMDVTVGGDPTPGDPQASIDTFGGKIKNIRIKERRGNWRVIVTGQGADIADAVTAEIQFNEPFEGPSPQENPVTVNLKTTTRFKVPNIAFTGDPMGHSWTGTVGELDNGGGLAATSDPIPLSYTVPPPSNTVRPWRVKGDLRENAEYRVVVIVKDDNENEVDEAWLTFDPGTTPAPSADTLKLTKTSRKAVGSSPIAFPSDPAGSLYTVTATLLDANGKPIGQPGVFDIELGRDELGALRTTMIAAPPTDDATRGIAIQGMRIQEKTNGDRVVHANLTVTDFLGNTDSCTETFDRHGFVGTDGFDVAEVADVQLQFDAIVGPPPTSNQIALYNWQTKDRWVSAPLSFDEDPSGQSLPVNVIFKAEGCDPNPLVCCPLIEDCGVHDEEEMLME